jgi:hypothetical protein
VIGMAGSRKIWNRTCSVLIMTALVLMSAPATERLSASGHAIPPSGGPSCAGPGISRPCGSTPTYDPADGEALFIGLFFGLGPVADLFPEIWKTFHPAQDTVRAALLAERVLVRIRLRDPGFFSRFEADLLSGDHLRIERSLDEASRLTLSALRPEFATGVLPIVPAGGHEGGVEIDRGGDTVGGTAGGTDGGDQVLIVVDRVVVVVAYVVAAEVLVYDRTRFWHGERSGASRLRREMWVDLVARRLGEKR